MVATSKSFGLMAFLLVTLCASAFSNKAACNDYCCRFLENIPGKLKSLRDFFGKIKPYYEANDELDSVLLDDGLYANMKTRYGCHVVNEVLRFYRGTVLPAAMNDTQKNEGFQKPIESIGDGFERIARDILHCKKHFECMEPFQITLFKKSYNEMERDKGMFKAMGELDVLFNYIEDYLVSMKRRR